MQPIPFPYTYINADYAEYTQFEVAQSHEEFIVFIDEWLIDDDARRRGCWCATWRPTFLADIMRQALKENDERHCTRS